MQELLVMLHSRYDLIKWGFFEQGILEEITARVSCIAGNVAATGIKTGSGVGGSGSSNEVQRGSIVGGFVEDAVGIGSHVVDGVAIPTELSDADLGVEGGKAEKAKKTQSKAGFVVGWRPRC